MLLTGLQSQTVGRIAEGIDADADDTARHLALVGFGGGEVTSMRTAKSHRQTETLVRTQYNVGTPFTWRRDECEAQQVGSNGHLHTFGFPFGNLGAVVDNLTKLVGTLEQDAKVLLAAIKFIDIVNHDLNALEVGTGLDDLDALREHIVGDEEFLYASFHLGAAAGVPEHQHGFSGGCAFIQQRSVGQRHCGKVADDGLEVQQGLKTAL